jgi:hypothetical protein
MIVDPIESVPMIGVEDNFLDFDLFHPRFSLIVEARMLANDNI